MTMIRLFLVLSALALGAGAAPAEAPWPPETFTCYYGPVEETMASRLKSFELLVVHPGDDMTNLTHEKVQLLKNTGKAKTVVGYISIGESDRSPGGPPEVGQEMVGPTYVGADLEQATAKNGYPARFMDQRAFVFGPDGFLTFGVDGKPEIVKGQDGHPDENGVWGSYYVKADDPQWRKLVFERLEQLDALGLDGFFLDTVDTASPWGDYGWTSSGMLDLVSEIRKKYPNKRIIGNRGLFYLGSNDAYANLIDAVLFESLLTEYTEATKKARISPWARWHIQALDQDVVPAVERTDMHLLVLDYLNPEQEEATQLVQSMRTLLADTPHSVTFSHPLLKIPGWPAKELLESSDPASIPSVKAIALKEGSKPGEFSLEVDFEGTVPSSLKPDLRITTRDGLQPSRAAQLPLAPILTQKAQGRRMTLTSEGLDKDTSYRIFFRLINEAPVPQSPFGWTSHTTRVSDLPGQVKDLESRSVPQGLQLSFTTEGVEASRYRVYRLRGEDGREQVAEGAGSPITVSQLAVGEAGRFTVVGVDEQGREGYPSQRHLAVRQDVVPPPVPGAPALEGNTVSWAAVEGAASYRVYVVPRGETFRLPLLTEETEIELENVQPGSYQVFLTSVDDSGNQSQPGPSVEWTAP